METSRTIVYDNSKKEFVCNDNRPNFPQDVRDYFSAPAGMDICHGISFKAIAYSLRNALNFAIEWLKDNTLLEYVYSSMLCFIGGTVCSVYRIDCKKIYEIIKRENYVVAAQEYMNRICSENAQIVNGMKNILNTKEQIFTGKFVFSKWEEDINNILYELNNCLSNLRIGYSCSNRSIKDAFDCTAYTYYSDCYEEGYFQLTNRNDNIAITNMTHLTYCPPREKSALYVWTGNYKGNFFLYSSKNELFATNQYVDKCKVPVVYYDYLEQRWDRFNIY